jgi:DMSO/TMAO reductase YedYZ molybdopterin-dependent catalytic subunit
LTEERGKERLLKRRTEVKERRQFLKIAWRALVGAGVFSSSGHIFLRPLWGEERKIIIPKGTKREYLAQRNPGNVDTRNLDITPLKDFQTMGATENKVDLSKWSLEVTGRVKRPLALTFSQLLEFPSREDRVLLICPGFFANHGLWKGIRMEELLRKAETEKGASFLSFTSLDGGHKSMEKFPMKEVLSGKVFLAYGVNGEPLPEKHGFPLRVVAEGHYGSRWRKFVEKMEVE